MKQLKLLTDANFGFAGIANFPSHVIGGNFTANEAVTVNIPQGAELVLFEIHGDFYCSIDDETVATIPAGTAVTCHVINSPTARSLDGRTKLSLISPGEQVYTLSFYKAS